MPRKKRSTAIFTEATSTAETISIQDQAVEAKAEEDRSQKTLMALSRIKPRHQDTRPIQQNHVQELRESIAALGLIEPLVIDSQGLLLAGGHRLTAIHQLQEVNPDIFNRHFPGTQIPVRMMAFSADSDPELALQVELAENEKRVNYSKDQIERLAERLRSLNYREIKGRPKKGEKALGPALAVAIGVSTRYVRKVLNDQKNDPEKNRNSVPIFPELSLLKNIERDLKKLIEHEFSEKESPIQADLLNALPDFLDKVQARIREQQPPPKIKRKKK